MITSTLLLKNVISSWLWFQDELPSQSDACGTSLPLLFITPGSWVLTWFKRALHPLKIAPFSVNDDANWSQVKAGPMCWKKLISKSSSIDSGVNHLFIFISPSCHAYVRWLLGENIEKSVPHLSISHSANTMMWQWCKQFIYIAARSPKTSTASLTGLHVFLSLMQFNFLLRCSIFRVIFMWRSTNLAPSEEILALEEHGDRRLFSRNHSQVRVGCPFQTES